MGGLIKREWLAMITLLLLSSHAHSDELVLIVNQANTTKALTKTQVIDMYMGKYVAFPDGKKASPIDLHDQTETKAKFYDTLVSMPLPRINSYWSRVKFSGRARPPTVIASEQDAIKFVRDNEHAIAYVHKSNLTSDLKVVFSFDE